MFTSTDELIQEHLVSVLLVMLQNFTITASITGEDVAESERALIEHLVDLRHVDFVCSFQGQVLS